MTDNQLLHLAAKAAGHPSCVWRGTTIVLADAGERLWNPLTDDGDALRLAVDLGLRIYPHASTASGYICSAVAGGDNTRLGEAIGTGDVRADTRRAIVRAAAAIGEAMP